MNQPTENRANETNATHKDHERVDTEIEDTNDVIDESWHEATNLKGITQNHIGNGHRFGVKPLDKQQYIPLSSSQHLTSSLSLPAPATAAPSTPAASSSPNVPRFGMFWVWVSLILAHHLWSIFHVLGVITFPYIPSFVLPSLRAIQCIPFFYALGYYYQSPKFYVVSPRDLMWIALAGILGNFFNQQFLNLGIVLTTSAVDAGLVQPSVPVFTMIIAVLRKQERLTKGKLIGLITSTIGGIIIVIQEEYSPSNPTTTSSRGLRFLGLLLVMAQCFVWSWFLTIQRPVLARGVTVYTFTFWMFLWGGVFHIIFGIYWDIYAVDWWHIPWYIWISVLYIGIGATVCAFLLLAYAGKYLPASIIGMGTLFMVIFTPTLSMIFLGEVLGIGHIFGGLCIAGGLLVVIYTRNREAKYDKMTIMGQPNNETIGINSIQHKDDEQHILMNGIKLVEPMIVTQSTKISIADTEQEELPELDNNHHLEHHQHEHNNDNDSDSSKDEDEDDNDNGSNEVEDNGEETEEANEGDQFLQDGESSSMIIKER